MVNSLFSIPISILFLSKNKRVERALRSSFKEAGVETRFSLIKTSTEALERFNKGSQFDLLLVESSVNKPTLKSTIIHTKNFDRRLPCLFLYRHGDEETTHIALEAGADTIFPLEDDLSSMGLIPTLVLRMVRKSADYRARVDELQENRMYLRTLLDNANDGIALIKEQKFIEVNPLFEALLGYTAEELIGRSPWEFTPEVQPDGRRSNEIGRMNIAKAQRGEHQIFEWQFLHRSGALIDSEVSVSSFSHLGEQYTLGIVRDIQERKQSEQELFERETAMRALLNAPPETFMLVTINGKIQALNEAAASTFGKSADELIGVNVFKLFPPDIAEGWRKNGDKVAKTKKPVRFEDIRDERYYENSLYPVFDEDGEVTHVAVYAQDVTEKRKAEFARRESDARYRGIVNAQADLINRYLPNGEITFVNKAYCQFFGATPEEIIGTNLFDTLPAEKSNTLKHNITFLNQDTPMIINESMDTNSRGESYWFQWVEHALFDQTGKIVEIQGVGRDITERIHAENALKKSEEDYRLLFENNQSAIFVTVGNDIVKINPMFCEMSGYSMDEALSMQLLDFIHPDDHEISIERGRAILADESISPSHIYRSIHKDGSVRFSEVLSKRIIWEGEPALLTIAADVTERTRATQQLQLLSEAIQQSSNAIAIIDTTGIVEYANRTFIERNDFDPEEIIGKNWRSFLSKSSALSTEFPQIQQTVIGNKDRWKGTFADTHRDGSTVWREATISPILDVEGSITHSVYVSDDITERKKAEEALRLSEERFRIFFEQEPAYCYMISPDSTILDVNQSALSALGYNKEELIGKPVSTIYAPESLPKIAALLEEWRETGELRNEEMVLITKKGARRVVLLSVNTIKNESGEIMRSISVQQDITDRKQAEDALRQSDIRFRSLIEHTTEAIFCYEPYPPIPIDLPIEDQVRRLYDCTLIECNDVCARSYGYDHAKEVIGKKLTELFGTSSDSLDGLFTAMVEGDYQISDGEGVEVLDDGSKRFFLNNGYGVIEDGNLIRIWGNFRDVTDRKETEIALKESETRYRGVVNAQADLIVRFLPNGEITFVNEAYGKFYGVQPEELIGTDIYFDIPIDEQASVKQHLASLNKDEPTGVHENRNISIHGESRWMHWTNQAFFNQRGELIEYQAVGRDITDRKLAEEALREREEQYRTLLETIPHAIQEIDTSGVITFVNKAHVDIHGFKKVEIVGTGVWEKVRSDFIQSEYQRNLRNTIAEQPFPETYSIKHHTKDGREIDVQIDWNYKRDAHNNVIGFISIMTDITERVKAEEKLRIKSELEHMVATISTRLLSTRSDDLDEELTLILAELGNYFKLSRVGIWKISPEGNYVSVSNDWHSEDLKPVRDNYQALPADKFPEMIERMSRGDVVKIEDPDDFPEEMEAEKQLFLDDGTPAYINIPAIFEGNLIGSLMLVYDPITNPISDDAIPLLRTISESIAGAIQRRQTEQNLHLHAERLMIINEIARSILAAESPTAIAQGVLDRITGLIPAIRSSITQFVFDQDNVTIQVLAAVPGEGMMKAGTEITLPAPQFDQLSKLREGQAYVHEDISTVRNKTPLHNEMIAEGVRSYANIPLIVGGELIGSFNIGSKEIAAFDHEHMNIATEISHSLATALQNARLYEQIVARQEQLRQTTIRLADVQEEERKHLSQELHDRVGQNLTALSINMNVVKSLLTSDDQESIIARLAESQRVVEETTQHIRDVMSDLRPPVLDDYGLLAAIRWYIESITPLTEFPIEVVGEELSPRLESNVEIALYRITQEALTNVIRHANPTQVTVSLLSEVDTVNLLIDDDGSGFDPNSVERGWGINIMRERSEAIGGVFKIDSMPEKGTRVSITVMR